MSSVSSREPIQVYLVDDDEDHLRLLSMALSTFNQAPHKGLGFSVHSFSDATEAVAALPVRGPVAIVCDYNMPGGTGLEWLADFTKSDVGPVLMLTGHGDEQVAAEAFRAGAADYLVKSQVLERPDLLQRAISQAVRRYRLERHNRKLARELKVANSKLEDRNANLRQLTEAMTHDLQTPLVSVTGAVDALKVHLGSGADETVARWLACLDSAVGRMMTMLDDLTVYAKAGEKEIEPRPVPIADALHAAIEELTPVAAGKGVKILLEPITAVVLGEASALYRIFANLVGNAVKYLDDGGDGIVKIYAAQRNGLLQVRVEDNGPGIHPDQLTTVFLPFKRASLSRPGTGLGLSIVKRYVDALGGRVRLESDGKRGTTAVVELHLAAREAEVMAA